MGNRLRHPHFPGQEHAATALPLLGLDVAAADNASYFVEKPSARAALSSASWATAIYEAVLNPTDAARWAASKLEAETARQLGSIASLHGATANMTRASLSSDYAQLAQSLPNLIGQIELANIHVRDADRLPVQRLLSDIYAVAGWTLIKADSPSAAWVAARRAI
jgi:hypothetical protein